MSGFDPEDVGAAPTTLTISSITHIGGSDMKISHSQFFQDLTEFAKEPRTDRNKYDLRLGQWFCNKYLIMDNQRLFYTEKYIDCINLIETNYVEK